MLRRIILPTIIAVLAFGLWISPHFNEIAAGVAIFLFGMLFLEEGFKAFTGGLLEGLLNRTTDRFWKALSFGAVTTTIMQSSSLVSLITISFLSAGLIELVAGIGIVFGADIGTTTGAWLIAGFGLKVDIAAYAMPMLVFGVILVFQSSKTLKGIGSVLAGLGFLFLGIHHMTEGFQAFRDTIDLARFAMPGFAGLVVFTLIGTVATVIMQSSHATLVLILTALAAEQITYDNALALAIGANIGTTITAIIGSLGSNYQGKRLAAANVIFKVVTALIAIVFISQFIAAVDVVADFLGIAPDNFTLKLALFHTIFNVVGVAVMTPLVGRLVALLSAVIRQPAEDLVEPKYLNEAALQFPETVLRAVTDETLHLYDNAFEIIAHGLNLHRHDILSERDLQTVVGESRRVMAFDLDTIYERKVKVLYGSILEFIGRAQSRLPTPFAEKLYELRTAGALIVQTVKEVKHLRKNLSLHMNSPNVYVRRDYDRIRVELAAILRKLDELRNAREGDAGVLDLDEFKLSIEQSELFGTSELDRLILDRRITTKMGTSLMNDLTYARDAIWHLVKIGNALYGSSDVRDKMVEQLLALTDEDLDEIRREDASRAGS
jgi:phosphate:Na+ symporter